jgi:hypothetical protein
VNFIGLPYPMPGDAVIVPGDAVIVPGDAVIVPGGRRR